MQNQLYTKPNICQPVTSAQAPSSESRALAALMLVGINPKVLGRAAIPKDEIHNGNWLARSWRSDSSTFPDIAWRPLMELNKAGITPLDVWVFHERTPSRSSALSGLRKHLPSIDTVAISRAVRSAGSTVARHLAALPELRHKLPKLDGDTAIRNLRNAGEAAAPVVGKIIKTTAKVAMVATPLIVGAALIGLSVIATDPVLVIVMPADDGGDPIWIEIARWYEE